MHNLTGVKLRPSARQGKGYPDFATLHFLRLVSDTFPKQVPLVFVAFFPLTLFTL